jgi:hypothetical protein
MPHGKMLRPRSQTPFGNALVGAIPLLSTKKRKIFRHPATTCEILGKTGLIELTLPASFVRKERMTLQPVFFQNTD